MKSNQRKKLPDFAVIGAQKSGSTFLLERLRQHPEVYMPRSEVAYFEDGVFEHKSPDEFSNHFRNAPTNCRIGFKRPNLLGLAESPMRIHSTLGEIQLIAILRDPTDRAISAYYHYMATGLIPTMPPEVGFRKILAGELQGYPRSQEVINFGYYHKHLSAYAKLFNKQNICVIHLENLENSSIKLSSFLRISKNLPNIDSQSRPMAAPYNLNRIRIKRILEKPARIWLSRNMYFEPRQNFAWQGYLRTVRAFDRLVLSRVLPSSKPELTEYRKILDGLYLADQQGIQNEWNAN